MFGSRWRIEAKFRNGPVEDGDSLPMNRILILFAHPAYQSSRANRHMVAAVRDLEGVMFRDLYELYPDFTIDVVEEQRLLVAHDVIVFHHPFYWYSCPALLKEWMDLVLEHGFAYGKGGAALEGKRLITVTTTGGSRDAYHREGHNHFEIQDFLAPFEQTANLCGMRYLPPYVVHEANRSSIEDMQRHAVGYRSVIEGLRDGTLDFLKVRSGAYLNEAVEEQTDA